MALQKVFKESYVETLRSNVTPEKYRGEAFEYDPAEVRLMANVHQPEDLAERLDPNNDLESAIALYEEYKELTPLSASRMELWTYLTHVDLFTYMQKRFPDVFSEKGDVKFIQYDSFLSSGSLVVRVLLSR